MVDNHEKWNEIINFNHNYSQKLQMKIGCSRLGAHFIIFPNAYKDDFFFIIQLDFA